MLYVCIRVESKGVKVRAVDVDVVCPALMQDKHKRTTASTGTGYT